VRCLRVLLNTEPGFEQVLQSKTLVTHIAYGLYTTNNKLRALVAEVLAALCVLSTEGHQLVLVAFSEFCVAHEEKFRFEYLVQSLGDESDEGFEYRTAGLTLINAIIGTPESLHDRVLLRNEFIRRGLDDMIKVM
jgi:diaphanous 1